MRKVLFFMLLIGVLFIGSVVHADTFVNKYVTDWTLNGKTLTKLTGYDDTNGIMPGATYVPVLYNVLTDFELVGTPSYARFHIVFDTSISTISSISYFGCDNETGICTNATITNFLENISLSISMLQDGLKSYCAFQSGEGNATGAFIIDCPVPHKTKHITGLSFEIAGNYSEKINPLIGVGKTVSFIGSDSVGVLSELQGFRGDMNSKLSDIKTDMNSRLQTINGSLGTINGTIGGLPQSVYNKFNPDLTAIKNAIVNSATDLYTQNQDIYEKQKLYQDLNTRQEIDATNKSTQATQDQTDYLKDNTAPDSDISSLGNVTGIFPPGPLDSLLNIPFTFLSVLTSSFSGTCVPMETDFVFDSKLTIPCFSEMFYGKVPTLLMTFLQLIPSAFILMKYFKHLYKKVDRAMSMESNSDDEWGVI